MSEDDLDPYAHALEKYRWLRAALITAGWGLRGALVLWGCWGLSRVPGSAGSLALHWHGSARDVLTSLLGAAVAAVSAYVVNRGERVLERVRDASELETQAELVGFVLYVLRTLRQMLTFAVILQGLQILRPGELDRADLNVLVTGVMIWQMLSFAFRWAFLD